MKSNFWKIKSGRHGRLGVFYRDGYTVHVTGEAAIECRKLSDAKKIAVEHGASGKFAKRTIRDGRNTVAEYTDAAKENGAS